MPPLINTKCYRPTSEGHLQLRFYKSELGTAVSRAVEPPLKLCLQPGGVKRLSARSRNFSCSSPALPLIEKGGNDFSSSSSAGCLCSTTHHLPQTPAGSGCPQDAHSARCLCPLCPLGPLQPTCFYFPLTLTFEIHLVLAS